MTKLRRFAVVSGCIVAVSVSFAGLYLSVIREIQAGRGFGPFYDGGPEPLHPIISLANMVISAVVVVALLAAAAIGQWRKRMRNHEEAD